MKRKVQLLGLEAAILALKASLAAVAAFGRVVEHAVDAARKAQHRNPQWR